MTLAVSRPGRQSVEDSTTVIPSEPAGSEPATVEAPTPTTCESEFGYRDAHERAAVAATDLSDLLCRAVAAVARNQLVTGEIPTYRQNADGVLSYCSNVLMSTLAHDALAVFDPASTWADPQAIELVGPAKRRWLTVTAVAVRRRLRDFVAWQERSDSRWQFLGRGSGLAPDAATTACAAAVLVESSSPQSSKCAGWQRHVAALNAHRAACGRFYTYVCPQVGGYSWIADDGRRTVGFDRVVNAHVLRFLHLVGEDVDPLLDYLHAELATSELETGSPDHPNPLVLVHAAARALRGAESERVSRLRELLLRRLLDRVSAPDGTFAGGLLSASLAACALLDLGDSGALVAACGRRLAEALADDGSDWYEGYVEQGFGSPSLSLVFAASTLVRCAAATGGQLR